jgi:hypothetical protein
VPEPLERASYLRQVADAVDLQPTEVGEVLEELNSHLSDAAAGWRESGLDPDDAERRALRGLGDPAQLGRELGKARHERRQLLAAAGGGIWSALTFGIWSFLFVWILFGGLGLVVTVATVSVLHGFRIETGNWLSGPAGSLITVALTTLWFAWMGWVLPQRVARAARRSVRGVQRAVGIGGFAIGTAILWTLPTLIMDPVLAIGLPLGPLAFLVAAQRPCRATDPFPVTTLRTRLGLAVAVATATVVMGLATMGPSTPMERGFGFDVSHIGMSDFPGLDPADSRPSVSFQVTPGTSPTLTASAFYPDDAWLTAFAARYPTTSLEIWPLVAATSDLYVPGPAPLATMQFATTSTAFDNPITMAMAMPRTPELVTTVLVAVGSDGSRVVIGPPDANQTPTWHGTLFDWWFAGG